jgi:hypothetical protein
MHHSIDLARQLAQDRHVRYDDWHRCRDATASWNRRLRRTIRVAVRRDESAFLDGH